WTQASNFDVTSGAYQTSLSGSQNAFVTKLNSTGTALVWSTYLGAGGESGKGITLDSSGNVWLTGSTGASSFPTTTGAFQSLLSGTQDAFLTSFSSSGALRYSTFLGGSGSETGTALAADTNGNVFVTGSSDSTNFPTTSGALQGSNAGGTDAFVAEFSSSGSRTWATLLGGSGSDSGAGLAVNSLDQPVAAVSTTSSG